MGTIGIALESSAQIYAIVFCFLLDCSLLFSQDVTSLPASAEQVTGSSNKGYEVLPACSPDGLWLAFEYTENTDPRDPHVGILRLDRSGSWRPVISPQPGHYLFVGDLSWSPDSRWLAVITDYPNGRESAWSDSNLQVAKINIYTQEVVRLTNFPVGTTLGPTTAWMRSNLIVFPGPSGDIYGISPSGGKSRKLVNVPKKRCHAGTNTLAAAPDTERVAFVMDAKDDNEVGECSALWVSNIRKGNLQRIATKGLRPLSPFWLNRDTILFAGRNANDDPIGIYSVSLSTKKIVPLLEGAYLTPTVCGSTTLYFSWRLANGDPKRTDEVLSVPSDLYGFHIWKVPLRDVLH